jgi:hypothetical protein
MASGVTAMMAANSAISRKEGEAGITHSCSLNIRINRYFIVFDANEIPVLSNRYARLNAKNR